MHAFEFFGLASLVMLSLTLIVASPAMAETYEV
jgi:hypothetical protein